MRGHRASAHGSLGPRHQGRHPRQGRRVPAAEAESIVAGYLVVNDVSARDWQFKAPTHTLGKSFDFIDERYSSVDNNPATLVEDSIVHNARIVYDLERQGLEVTAFVDNLADEDRPVFRYDLISAGGYSMQSYAKPRWWGVSVRKRF